MSAGLAAILLLLITCCPAAGQAAPLKVADPYAALEVQRPHVRLPAPDFTLPSLDGRRVSLADFRGKVVLLNFWATWCQPCREEMPSLQALWESYRDRSFAILAVAADRGSLRPVKKFADRHGLDFPVLLDADGRVRGRYEVYALPMSYLIGRDGRISGRVPAARDWNGAAARALIEHLLAQEAD